MNRPYEIRLKQEHIDLLNMGNTTHHGSNIVEYTFPFKLMLDIVTKKAVVSRIKTLPDLEDLIPKTIEFTKEFEYGVHHTWGSRAIECYETCKKLYNLIKEYEINK